MVEVPVSTNIDAPNGRLKTIVIINLYGRCVKQTKSINTVPTEEIQHNRLI